MSFRVLSESQALASAVEPHDYVFVALQDERIDDVRTFVEDLQRVCRRTLIILSTLDWSDLGEPAGYRRSINPIADAVTQPPWDTGTILIQQRV